MNGNTDAALAVLAPGEADPLGDAAAAMEAVRVLRAERRIPEALRMTVALGQRHVANPAVAAACVELLHRCGGWTEALELLGQARAVRAVKATRNLRIVEADCLLRTGRQREAHAITADIDADAIRGRYRPILDRVRAAPPDVVTPEILEIEAMFAGGEPVAAAAAFRAYVAECRAAAAAAGSVRDRESQRFAAAFSTGGGAQETGPVVRLISDSIAMPRAAIGVELADTYPWLAQAAIGSAATLTVDSRRQRTVRELPDILRAAKPCRGFVLQVGIVDCAPRVFSETDVECVRRVHGDQAAKALIMIAQEWRAHLQGDRKTSVYVPLAAFRDALSESVDIASRKSDFVVLMNIVTPSRNQKKMVGTALSNNIADYNKSISEIASDKRVLLLDADEHIWSCSDAYLCFTMDNYHYNAIGHQRCAAALAAQLKIHLAAA